MIRVMLDEMISPNIVKNLWAAGVDTICARDRDMLSGSDQRLWRHAQNEARALVTGNNAHFERLAKASTTHHGLIALPTGGTRETQFSRIMSAVSWTMDACEGEPSLVDLVAYVDEDGNVYGRILCANNDNFLVRDAPQKGEILPLH